MTRLLRVELSRLRWRRAIVLLMVACVAVPLVVLISQAWSTRPFSDADVAAAEEMAAAESQQPYVADEIQRCEADPQAYGVPDGGASACADLLVPTYEDYLYRQVFDLATVREDAGLAAVVVLAGLMMLVGTTFAGHDWNTGSMSNQVLFEPRRLRVWSAKALAVTITGAVVAAAVLALFWAGAALVASSRDIVAPPGVWGDVLRTQARAVPAVALAGLLGYALTMLFRSTVATLGLMFGVAVAGSFVLLAVLGESATRWLLPTNFLGFVLGDYEYFDDSACGDAFIPEQSDTCFRTIGAVDGGVYLAVVLLVVMALSLWSMQRRDIP